MIFGSPNGCIISYLKTVLTSLSVAFEVTFAMGQAVRCSTHARINRSSEIDAGNGPEKSIEKMKKRLVSGKYISQRYIGRCFTF